MVIDEHSRHQLHNRLEDVLGADAAGTLMAHLPPVGWADVATKHDLGGLEERIDLRFSGLEERIDLRFVATDERINSLKHELTATFRGEIVNQTRTMVYANLAAIFTCVSVVFAATRI